MPRVSAAFFGVGALCVLTGMLWGIHMAMSKDFTLMPAHAHLNLVGWVTMSLYGTFYALTANTLSPRLAWGNFVISALGVLVMIPSLGMMLSSGFWPGLGGFAATGGGAWSQFEGIMAK